MPSNLLHKMNFQFGKKRKSCMELGLVNMELVALVQFCISSKNCRSKSIKNGFYFFFRLVLTHLDEI